MDKTKVFGLYPGCEIMTPDGTVRFHAINGKAGVFASSDVRPSRFYGFDECQLILTDLKDISDEDAMDVAKLLGMKEGDTPEIKRQNNGVGFLFKRYGFVYNFFLLSSGRAVNGYYERYPHHQHFDPLTLNVYDYLRSRYYNLPYMGMDLVENGIAVLKTK